MKKIAFFAVFAFFVCGADVFAQGADDKINEILLKMEAADKTINSLEVDYTQDIFYSATGETQNIKGNLKYKRPSSIFILQKTPQEQKIYIDGKKITIYTPDNAQAITDKWNNLVNGDFAPASMINFGSNWQSIKKDNVIRYVGEDDDNYAIEIYPAKKKDWTMRMDVSKKTMRPQRAVVTAPGLSIKVQLTNYKVNPEFKKDIFKFVPPEGTEVIKLN